MARSIKKGPYVFERLLKRVRALNESGKKEVIKTWSRRSTIYPEFIGHTFAVHNGKEFIPVKTPVKFRSKRLLARTEALRIEPKKLGSQQDSISK